MDEIRLTGMHFFGYHGVLPEETVTGQRFIVHVTLGLPLRKAGITDSVRSTVDYGKVYATVKAVVEGTPRKLIESVAEAIAEQLLTTFASISTIEVEVEKPGAPIPGIFDSVAVKIYRER